MRMVRCPKSYKMFKHYWSDRLNQWLCEIPSIHLMPNWIFFTSIISALRITFFLRFSKVISCYELTHRKFFLCFLIHDDSCRILYFSHLEYQQDNQLMNNIDDQNNMS